MPIRSRWTVPIPDIHVASLVFSSPTHPLPSSTPVFIDPRNTANYLTLRAYRLWSQRLAAGLLKHGFQYGDRLLLFSGNNIFFPVVLMGVAMAGGIFTGANPTYVARELAHQLKDSGATFLLCSPTSLQTASQAASQAGLSTSRVFVFDDNSSSENAERRQQGCRHWSTLFASVGEGMQYQWAAFSSPDDSAQTLALNYSSGTTGLSKGVEITHKNYVANALQTLHNLDLIPDTAEDRAGNRSICPLPMYHALGQTLFAVAQPARGVPVYIMQKFDLQDMAECIQKFQITELMLVPPIVVALAKHPRVRAGNWDLSSLRHITAGAAPLGREVSQELEDILAKLSPKVPRVNLRQGYGMTELTCSALACDPRLIYTTSTVGELLANCEARIMNPEETAEVPVGERGELWVKAPNVMKGYWRNEKATRATMTNDGWLKTGDICYIDKDGLFYVVDRIKELIKVKGNQVAPAELEALLLDHPAVADVAVIGVKRGEDEYPRAYIVLRPGSKASPEDIVGFMEKRVSKTKRITGGVCFVDTIPKNPSGKILRKILREQALAEEEKTKVRPRL